jgi:kumamolisin
MAFENRVQLPGSAKQLPHNCQRVGPVPPDAVVSVTVLLRRKGDETSVAHTIASQRALTHDEFPPEQCANPADIQLVEEFAHHFHLTVAQTSLPQRRVVLTGAVGDMARAFEVDLNIFKSADTGHTFRGRAGTLSVPAELEPAVIAVLGLDDRPNAKPHFRIRQAASPAASFTPPQIAALYNFPAGLTGAGQTVAIIELGGGYQTADLQTYFQSLGLKQPKVTAVAVDGGKNTPGSDADGEVLLDIEVVGSIAPDASIAVYFAPNTDQGFVDAISEAVHDTARKPSVISISWGGPEDSWTQQAQNAMNAALQDAATLGVTVTAASGDNGSTDGVTGGKLHVDFPASSPYALACGGTTLSGSGSQITAETVWNETAKNEGSTGGGVSAVFPLPSYQASAGVPKQPQTSFAGRGVPDVSGDADPETGYQVRVNGKNEVIGGTSAVAPLWAALVALLNQKLGAPVGFPHPKIYPLGKNVFRDITTGNNDDANLGYYSAKAGWDPCTGLGSPNGAALLSALTANTTTSKADPNQTLAATVVVRRPPTGSLPANAAALPREQVEQALSANPDDLAAVRKFASAHNLKVTKENPPARTLHVEGTVEQLDKAFGVNICWCHQDDGLQYLGYEGQIVLPPELEGIVEAVLGLDQRPVARHHSSGT